MGGYCQSIRCDFEIYVGSAAILKIKVFVSQLFFVHSRSRGHEVDSWPFYFHAMTLGKLFTHDTCASVTKQCHFDIG